MKIFLLILLHFHISGLSAYTMTRIDGVEGLVEKVNFDLDGNIYVATNTETGHKLYKLNPLKELLWTSDLPSYVELVKDMLISSRNDIYFYLFNNSNQTLAILRSDSSALEEIEAFTNDLFFMDGNDNLFYSKKNGIHVLKPNASFPVLIRNLESFYVFRTQTVQMDSSGNIYLGVDSKIELNNTVALITPEALEEELPHAQIITVHEPYSQFIQNLIVDKNEHLWILLSDLASRDGIVKKLTNGVLETVTIDQNHPNIKMISGEDKIFIVAANLVENIFPSIYYITSDNEVKEIPELKNLTLDTFVFIQGIADSEGYAYFTTFNEFSSSLGPMVLIKPDEMIPNPITFEFPNIMIILMKLDFNEDVWIVTESQGIYYLRKGETIPEKINIPENSCLSYNDLNFNQVAKEILVSCADGLYTIDEDK